MAAATRPGSTPASRTLLGALSVAVVGALLVLVGCTGSESARQGQSRSRPADRDDQGSAPTTLSRPVPPEVSGIPDGWQPETLRWRDCDLPRGGQCAELRVPLDWQDPGGRQIQLALGRLPARSDRTAEGDEALVMNPGGPGGSGLELLSWDPTSDAIADRFDIVSWDPRGVGRSTALECDAGVEELQAIDPDPDDEAEQARLDSLGALVSRACSQDPELLAHLGTAEVARDLEAIRRALGDEPLNYLGYSYGTHIGQVYAAMYPTRIRTMVLDGVVDPSLGYEEFLVGQAVAFEAAFDENADACADAGRLRCGVTDLAAAYDRVLAEVEHDPLTSGDRRVGPAELTTAAIQTGYRPSGWRSLGKALAAALDGDGAPLWHLADAYYQAGGYASYAAVVCTDNPPPSGADAYRAFAQRARDAAPRFGGAVANELVPCATWPATPTATPKAIRAAGSPHILVVGNTGDPATPIANAVAVASSLESGVLVTVDADGHTAYGSNRCATELIDIYLIDIVVPADGTTCR